MLKSFKRLKGWADLPILFILILTLFSAGDSSGQDLNEVFKDTESPWRITADELSYDDQAEIYIAHGNVIITKMDRKITADTVHFDHKRMAVTASGNVVMTVDQDVISADSLEIDLTQETGTIHQGSLYLKRENFHIKGKNIRKTDQDSYEGDRVSITTCDGEKPAWKITGRNLDITIEGYGYAYHAAFWVKDIPVLYTPFIAFPVKLKRQTGLLAPQIGHSSRKGFEYIQPFFWAINDSLDATFYEHYMDFRGNKLGTEFRYMLSPLSKGTLMLDYLEDREIDDGLGDNSEDWGYDPSDDILRTNEDRYWFRMKHDNELPAGFFARLDIDFVSDQDYLQEFKNGYTGFRDAEDYFNKEFGRSLDDYNDPVRLNRFNINRRWSRYSFNAEVNWYDNVINRRWEDTDTTIQELPFIEFTGSKQRLLELPLYFSMENEYTHFYRENTTTPNSITQSHRVDVYPRIYLPLNFSYYLAVEPSLGIRETFWQVTEYEDQPDDMQDDETFFRDLYDWRLDLSTEVYNIFQTSGSQIDRIKHAVKPQIVYTYIPEEEQDEYPKFDALDRIAKQNQLTYSLTNLLTYRFLKDRPKKADNFSGDPQYHYQQFVRFYLEQSYDFNEAAENDPAEWKNGETQEPFSPVYGKLEITPKRYFSSTADAEWHPYESDIISHNVAVDMTDHRGNRLYVEHRYKKDSTETSPQELESIYSKLHLQLTEELSVFGEYEKDLYADTDLLTGIGTMYKAQCWSLELKYTKEIDEEDYSFMIGLHGLGELESDIQ